MQKMTALEWHTLGYQMGLLAAKAKWPGPLGAPRMRGINLSTPVG